MPDRDADQLKRMCQSKVRYDTRREAKKRMGRRWLYARVYECPVCCGFHVTSKKKIRRLG